MLFKRPTLILISMLFILHGCANIPVESIKLNQNIHANIADIHNKHVNLVHEYFDLKAELFDQWFLNTYEPAYRKNYQFIWNTRHPDDTFDLRNELHRRLYIQDVIAEYVSLAGQVRGLENDLVKKLDDGYSDILSANEAVTRLLQSSAAVTESQKALWNKTVGKVIPEIEADKVDQGIIKIQKTALQLIGH